MLKLLGLLGGREIDEWRDFWSASAGMVLNDLAANLLRQFDQKIAAAGLSDALLNPRSFILREIDPGLRSAGAGAVDTIVAEANAALYELAEYQAIWHDRPVLVQPRERSGSLFGMLALSAVSWPALLTGNSIGGLTDRARDRLRKAVHDHVVATLIEGENDHPALLEQLTELFRVTAREAKRHRRS